MTTSQRTRSGNAPASPMAWPAPNECAITPTGPPTTSRTSSARSRWSSAQANPVSRGPLSPCPRKSSAIGVIPERRDTWREVVEHAAVVVGAVEQQHRRRRRVAPAPEPQLRSIDGDELRAIGLPQDERTVVVARERVRRMLGHRSAFVRQDCRAGVAGVPAHRTSSPNASARHSRNTAGSVIAAGSSATPMSSRSLAANAVRFTGHPRRGPKG